MSSNKLFVCPRCIELLRNESVKTYIQYRGFYTIVKVPENRICPKCNGELIEIDILQEDAIIFTKITNDTNFLESMIHLKEKDPIEYQLKLNQFKTQIQQQENSRAQAANTVKCPRCGSTNITAGQRGYSLLTGFVGSGRTVNRCANCGHKWKP